NPAATPTPAVVPSATPIAMPPMGSLGLWSPNLQYDTCPSYPAGVVTDADKSAYLKALHDTYAVLGPDGQAYATWHPSVDPATGCRFGHEHGRNPAQAAIWPEVQDFFAYVRPDGTKDLAHAGVPFGYVNAQLDAYWAAQGQMIMRHEDHVGNKLEWADNLGFAINPVPGAPKQYTSLT